jgi:hypothetical protein
MFFRLAYPIIGIFTVSALLYIIVKSRKDMKMPLVIILHSFSYFWALGLTENIFCVCLRAQ